MSTNRLAEKKLAGLIALKLDVMIDDQRLGDFIRDNWFQIAPLAHLIHGVPDATKGPLGYTPEHKDDQADHTYLRNLAEKLRGIPVHYGTDDGDIRRLFEIAEKVSS
jgi:hypothetical protein